MTNQEKIKDWGLYEKAVRAYPDDWCKTNNIAPSDIVHSARMGYQTGALEMAEWKDKEFEKKRKQFIEKSCEIIDNMDILNDYTSSIMYGSGTITLSHEKLLNDFRKRIEETI